MLHLQYGTHGMMSRSTRRRQRVVEALSLDDTGQRDQPFAPDISSFANLPAVIGDEAEPPDIGTQPSPGRSGTSFHESVLQDDIGVLVKSDPSLPNSPVAIRSNRFEALACITVSDNDSDVESSDDQF